MRARSCRLHTVHTSIGNDARISVHNSTTYCTRRGMYVTNDQSCLFAAIRYGRCVLYVLSAHHLLHILRPISPVPCAAHRIQALSAAVDRLCQLFIHTYSYRRNSMCARAPPAHTPPHCVNTRECEHRCYDANSTALMSVADIVDRLLVVFKRILHRGFKLVVVSRGVRTQSQSARYQLFSTVPTRLRTAHVPRAPNA
jgi:hypothetical protein